MNSRDDFRAGVNDYSKRPTRGTTRIIKASSSSDGAQDMSDEMKTVIDKLWELVAKTG